MIPDENIACRLQPWCKGSTVSRHVRGLGFDSRVSDSVFYCIFGMSEVSGSIPVSGLCFLLIFVVFTLCLPCFSSLLSACTVTPSAPSTV